MPRLLPRTLTNEGYFDADGVGPGRGAARPGHIQGGTDAQIAHCRRRADRGRFRPWPLGARPSRSRRASTSSSTRPARARSDAARRSPSAGGRIVERERGDRRGHGALGDAANFEAAAASRARARGRRVQHADRPGAARARSAGARRSSGRGRPRKGAAAARQGRASAAKVNADPLASLQWDMQAIGATADGSYARQQGSHDVRVGIIDTGVDASHPDIAPNFDTRSAPQLHRRRPGRRRRRARPSPDRSCNDPSDVDEDGHGTHVAGTIGARAQRPRHRGRRAQGRPRQPARRPGLGLLLPRPDARRADLRRRPRHRRREHVVLHRPVAVQLRRQPGRLAGGAARAAADHRRHAARARLRPRARRDADRRRGQRQHRPRPPDVATPPARTTRTRRPRRTRARSTTRACRCRPRATA